MNEIVYCMFIFIVEILVLIFVEYLLSYPGAFVRFIIFREKNFKHY
jgi:hypothetical protein